MNAPTLLEPVSLLYLLCFVLLAGLAVFVASKGSRTRPLLRRSFCLLAFSLLAWQATLFLEIQTAVPSLQLALARANFAAAGLAVYFALRFVQEAPDSPLSQTMNRWLLLETGALSALALLTPLVVSAERVRDAQALTTFGVLAPAYFLHVGGYLAAALVLSFRERRRSESRREREQLTLVGLGMVATGGIALVTNALLPYGFNDFRFSDVGTLSTLLFVAAVAYATFIHGLFGLQVIIRKALVYGLLLAFVLGAYSSMLFLATEYLTESSGKLSQFSVLLIAFSVDPLRRFLEEKTGRLLFGRHGHVRKRVKERRAS
jgi:hypothetical protein